MDLTGTSWSVGSWPSGRGAHPHTPSQSSRWAPRLHPDCEEPVKGYLSGALADVHLQSSQAARATSTTKGHPPDWWLFALLNVHRHSRGEAIRHATQVVWLMAKGGIKVRKH